MAAHLLRMTSASWLSSSRSKTGRSTFGSSSIQGRRPNQEDRFHTCEQLPGRPECAMYAVYDGHGGYRAAQFCAEHMQGYLTKSKAFKARDLVKALQGAFRECEAEFIAIAGREGLRDGTTAVVTLVEADSMTVAHVGDSRAVLCRAGGETVHVTLDHKPELAAERKRIEALGGFVSYIGCWRAMGILAMSRAIGDLFLKPYVSPEPDVQTVPIGPSDEFIVLASDGLFDVFDNEQVIRLVRSAASPADAASLLTESAFAAGSLDNITAVVVALRGYQPASPIARSVAEPSASTAVRSLVRSLMCDVWGDTAGDGDSLRRGILDSRGKDSWPSATRAPSQQSAAQSAAWPELWWAAILS